MPQDGATSVLELGQNLNFSQNLKGKVVRTIRPFRRRIEKNSTTAYQYGECRCASI